MATGAFANIKWGQESTFGSVASNVDKAFGYGTEITGLDWDNDINPRRGLGNRNATAFSFGPFKGSFSVKFDLVDPWVFKLMMGYMTGSVNNYVFGETPALPSFTIKNRIDTMDNAEAVLHTFTGCVVTDWTMDCAVGNEPIGITLNIAFANVTEAVTTSALVSPTASLHTFAQAAWKKGTSIIAKVENVSIKCNQNAEMKAYLGSRIAQRARFGEREYDVTSLHYYGSTYAYLADFYGTTPNTGPTAVQGAKLRDWSLVITPVVGQYAGSTYTFSFTNGAVNRVSSPQRVGEDIMEDVSMTMMSLSMAVTGCGTAPTY